MATFTVTDSFKSVNMTLSSECGEDNPLIGAFLDTICALDEVTPVASVALTGTTVTTTAKDSRAFSTTLTVGNPPLFNVTTASAWSMDELMALQAFHASVNQLILELGLSALTCTYS